MAQINIASEREDQRQIAATIAAIIKQKEQEILSTFEEFSKKRRATMAANSDGSFTLSQVGLTSVNIAPQSNLTSSSKTLR